MRSSKLAVVAAYLLIVLMVPVLCFITGYQLVHASSITSGNVAFLGSVNTFTALQKFTAGISGDPAFVDLEVSGCPSGCTNPAITQAQILLGATTPVTLISAPSPGSLIVVDNVMFELVAGATAYANGTSVTLTYNGALSGAAVTGPCPVVLITGATSTICGLVGMDSLTPSSATTVGLSVTYRNTSGSAQFTCSATCGTLSYWIKYHVLSGL